MKTDDYDITIFRDCIATLQSLNYVSFTSFFEGFSRDFHILRKALIRIGNVKINVAHGYSGYSGLSARDLTGIKKVEYIYSRPCYRLFEDDREKSILYESTIKAIQLMPNVVSQYVDVPFILSPDSEDLSSNEDE